MIRWMLAITFVSVAMVGVLSSRNPALACNKTAGCVMDSLHEDDDMKRDGRMDRAIVAGRDNVEAFRALQAAQQNNPARK